MSDHFCSSELEKTIAVGSYGLAGHSKAEWFDSGEVTEPWEVLMDCPIADRFSGFATFAIDADFFFFGGYKYEGGYRDTDEIYKFCKLCLKNFKNQRNLASNVWQQVGRLKSARKGHAVTFFEGQFWVVGGQGDLETERCSIFGDEMICQYHDDYVFESYAFNPELFIVPKDFCQE